MWSNKMFVPKTIKLAINNNIHINIEVNDKTSLMLYFTELILKNTISTNPIVVIINPTMDNFKIINTSPIKQRKIENIGK